ncbi:hypothetical protein PVAP13_3KG560850 [Panicum virgatum]|uniref:Uncharacterized protein n=1 Tax=Panicum virgatum TaxID=38727 RepID=A0A8T0V3D4_PANVG|nr:hypothetical protein PVAP13_3KG560850 [Panicum virgatum]
MPRGGERRWKNTLPLSSDAFACCRALLSARAPHPGARASPRLLCPPPLLSRPPATALLTHRRAALLLPPLLPRSSSRLRRPRLPAPRAGELCAAAALGGPAPRASSAAPRACSAPRSPTLAAPTLPPPLRRRGRHL